MPQEGANLKAGSAIHVALAEIFLRHGVDRAMAALEREYKIWAEACVEWDDRLSWANVEKIMGVVLPAVNSWQWPFEVVAVEEPFEYEFEYGGTVQEVRNPEWPSYVGTEFKKQSKTVTGRPDLVIEYNGELGIVDHKTTWSMNESWARQFALTSQFTEYMQGVEKRYGRPCTTAWVLGIELQQWKTSPRTCKEHGEAYKDCAPQHVKWHLFGPFARDPWQTQQWEKMAERAIIQIDDVAQRAPRLEDVAKVLPIGKENAGVLCKSCDYMLLCTGELDADLIRAKTVYDPWDPRNFSHTPISQTKEVRNESPVQDHLTGSSVQGEVQSE